MEPIQIGATSSPNPTTIAEMFRQLAEREAEEIRKAREKALGRRRK